VETPKAETESLSRLCDQLLDAAITQLVKELICISQHVAAKGELQKLALRERLERAEQTLETAKVELTRLKSKRVKK
jgi:hypothetical protein